MPNYLRNEKGSTITLVLGTVIVVSLLLIPLVAQLNTGLLQSRTGAAYEQASEKAQSGVRIMRRLLKLTVDPTNTPAQNRVLVQNLIDQLKSRGLLSNTEWSIEPAAGNPERVVVRSSSGTGQMTRTTTAPLIILRFPTAGGLPGPGQTSKGTEFYHTRGAVVSYRNASPGQQAAYNQVFAACPAPGVPQPEVRVDNNYDPAAYRTEFMNYINYYLDDSRNHRPLPKSAIPVPAIPIGPFAPLILPVWTFDKSGAYSGLKHNGDIRITASPITINALPGGTALEAAGKVDIYASNSGDTTINGDLKAVGNIAFSLTPGAAKRIVKGTVYSKGSVTVSPVNARSATQNEWVVEGDLIAAGDITFSNVPKITVKGDLIAGGNITVDQSVSGNVTVEGHMSAKSISLNGDKGTVTIGHWNGNQPVPGDSKSLIAQNALNVHLTDPATSHLRVSGDISGGSFPSTFTADTVIAGGAFIAGGDIQIAQAEPWTIGGSVSASGNVTFNQIVVLDVKGDMIVKGNMLVIGSYDVTQPAVRNLKIGGSLISSGSIGLNTIGQMTVGGDMMSAGSMGVMDIQDELRVGGMFAALDHVGFALSFQNAATGVSLGGYYAGGDTYFPYAYQNGSGQGSICLTGIQPAGGAAPLEFGS